MQESVIRALDGSRRVGWAKYFDAQDEIAVLREALHRLSDAVVFHPRINNGDQILELVQVIREL